MLRADYMMAEGFYRAADIMTKEKVSVTLETPAMEIIHLLQGKHLIRVPVLDAEGNLKAS